MEEKEERRLLRVYQVPAVVRAFNGAGCTATALNVTNMSQKVSFRGAQAVTGPAVSEFSTTQAGRAIE